MTSDLFSVLCFALTSKDTTVFLMSIFNFSLFHLPFTLPQDPRWTACCICCPVFLLIPRGDLVCPWAPAGRQHHPQQPRVRGGADAAQQGGHGAGHGAAPRPGRTPAMAQLTWEGDLPLVLLAEKGLTSFSSTVFVCNVQKCDTPEQPEQYHYQVPTPLNKGQQP